jgi:hypothetical protein
MRADRSVQFPPFPLSKRIRTGSPAVTEIHGLQGISHGVGGHVAQPGNCRRRIGINKNPLLLPGQTQGPDAHSGAGHFKPHSLDLRDANRTIDYGRS